MRPLPPAHPDDPARLLAPRFRRHGTEVASRTERQLLAAIWQAPEQTRAALTQEAELTQQSVHRLLAALQGAGMVLFGPLRPPRHKGQPSPQLLLNPRFGCALGMSLDTDRVGIACMDFAGGHATRHFPIAGDPVEAVLDRIAEEAEALLAQMRFAKADVLGIGFAIAGFLMENGRYNPPDPLAHWAGTDLARTVSERFALPCWTDNSANTAALCEAMFGHGRRYRDLAYLSFNYGFGAGIVAGGALMRGGFGNAGEIGMIFTPEEARRRPALGLLLQHLRAAGHDMRAIGDLDRAMSPLWPEVADWADLVAPQFNRVVNAVAAIADPQCIVLGGQVPRTLAREFIARAEFYARPRHGHLNPLPRLEISDLGGETPAIGAACLPLRALAF
ncbi:ROK family transcriptional regulator [Poseidonocella sp. HB161398]|uniref:ROK family transcriptional regulator n=1 Tax=Poseidonocella sp. HB161398 TaxID=2320855 RepID=UPI0011086A5F|nr:ROK family transcriptional regulator [Poseidonocella sp. HB161398]